MSRYLSLRRVSPASWKLHVNCPVDAVLEAGLEHGEVAARLSRCWCALHARTLCALQVRLCVAVHPAPDVRLTEHYRWYISESTWQA